MVTITITAETPEEAAEAVHALARADGQAASNILNVMLDEASSDARIDVKAGSKATHGTCGDDA